MITGMKEKDRLKRCRSLPIRKDQFVDELTIKDMRDRQLGNLG